MLGDIVISVETAARQAAERGHSLLDEIRILMVSLAVFCFISSTFFTLCKSLVCYSCGIYLKENRVIYDFGYFCKNHIS